MQIFVLPASSPAFHLPNASPTFFYQLPLSVHHLSTIAYAGVTGKTINGVYTGKSLETQHIAKQGVLA